MHPAPAAALPAPPPGAAPRARRGPRGRAADRAWDRGARGPSASPALRLTRMSYECAVTRVTRVTLPRRGAPGAAGARAAVT